MVLYNLGRTLYYSPHNGEMAEWLKAPVLKTGIRL